MVFHDSHILDEFHAQKTTIVNLVINIAAPLHILMCKYRFFPLCDNAINSSSFLSSRLWWIGGPSDLPAGMMSSVPVMPHGVDSHEIN